MGFLIIGIVFLVGFVSLVIYIGFGMEAKIRQLGRKIKEAKDKFDEFKFKYIEAKTKATVAEGERIYNGLKDAAKVVDQAIATERDKGGILQAWLTFGAIWCLALGLFFTIFGLARMAHPTVGWYWFFIVLIFAAYYLMDIARDFAASKKTGTSPRADITVVLADHLGMKFLMGGRHYKISSPGPRYTPSLLVTMKQYPTTVIKHELSQDNVMTSGPESCQWEIKVGIRLFIHDLWLVIRHLGTDIDEILEKLLGTETTIGIVDMELDSIVRAWVGNINNIKTVDQGLASLDELTREVNKYFTLAMSIYGIRSDYPTLHHFRPAGVVITAREERTAQLIGIDTARHKADQRVQAGRGDAGYQRQIIEQKIAAIQSINEAQAWAKNLLLAIVAGGDDFAKLKDALKLTINDFEGIGGLMDRLGPVISGKGDRNQLLRELGRMSSQELNGLINQLQRLNERRRQNE